MKNSGLFKYFCKKVESFVVGKQKKRQDATSMFKYFFMITCVLLILIIIVPYP